MSRGCVVVVVLVLSLERLELESYGRWVVMRAQVIYDERKGGKARPLRRRVGRSKHEATASLDKRPRTKQTNKRTSAFHF